MPESLPMKTRLLLAGASLQLISLAKKSGPTRNINKKIE